MSNKGEKMLILHEGEILHTDSSTDILEHYGVKRIVMLKINEKNIDNNVSRFVGLEPMVKKVR